MVTPHQWQLPKKKHTQKILCTVPAASGLFSSLQGGFGHLCGPFCPNPGMQTCMVSPVLVLQPQWDVGWTPQVPDVLHH